MKPQNILLNFDEFPEQRVEYTVKSQLTDEHFKNIEKFKVTLKLIDFGHMKKEEETMEQSKFKGTPYTCPPE